MFAVAAACVFGSLFVLVKETIWQFRHRHDGHHVVHNVGHHAGNNGDDDQDSWGVAEVWIPQQEQEEPRRRCWFLV
jgi:hypothetical protein